MASAPYSTFRLLTESTTHARKWSKGTVEDWAEEAHKAARRTVYGGRLAAVLNEAIR